MRGGAEEMLDEIAFFFLGGAFSRGHADDALASAALRAKCAHRRALDQPAVGDADDAALIRDEVLHVDLALIRRELRQARRAMLIANFAQFFFDDLKHSLLFGKN